MGYQLIQVTDDHDLVLKHIATLWVLHLETYGFCPHPCDCTFMATNGPETTFSSAQSQTWTAQTANDEQIVRAMLLCICCQEDFGPIDDLFTKMMYTILLSRMIGFARR